MKFIKKIFFYLFFLLASLNLFILIVPIILQCIFCGMMQFFEDDCVDIEPKNHKFPL